MLTVTNVTKKFGDLTAVCDLSFELATGEVLGLVGQNGAGTVQSGALEMSNVDLSTEFTNMIIANRAYQANARIITTSDDILQELVNLKK